MLLVMQKGSETRCSNNLNLNAGDGREASTATLSDVADNLQPIYEDNHLAPEFSYVLYPADGLTPSASYIVVLDFIGARPFRRTKDSNCHHHIFRAPCNLHIQGFWALR